jgi:hypothetical protein
MEFRDQPDGRLRLDEEPASKLVHDFFEESKRVLDEGTRLLRTEIHSAKSEIRAEVKKVGPAAGLLGGGGVLLHIAALMLAATLAAVLATVMAVWVAYLITTVLFGAAGAILLATGRKRLTSIHIKPEHTIHRLEEDRRWTKELTQNTQSNLQHGT